MALKWFDPQVALDPTTGLPVAGGSSPVYALADAAHSTPLTITLGDLTTASTLDIGPLGVVPTFAVHDQYRVRWPAPGGDVILRSYDGLEEAIADLSVELAGLRETVEAGGGGGGGGGVSRHGALSELDNDDHQQYHTDTRGDARYYTKALVDQALADLSLTIYNQARARGNHTGVQGMSSITGLLDALAAKATVLSVQSVEEVPAGTPVGALVVVPTVTSYGDTPTVIGSSTSSSTASGATLAVAIPSTGTPAAGDLLVVALTTASSTVSQAWTPPDGTWTRVSPALVDLGGGLNQNTRVTAVFVKRLTGAPASSYTFTSTGSDAQRRIAAVAVVRGVDATTPVAAASPLVGVNGSGTTDVSVSGLATSRPRTLQLVWGWSNGTSSDDFATLPAPASGADLTQFAAETLPPTGSVSKTQLVAWRRALASSGAVGSIDVDFASRAQRAVASIILNPAVA